MLKYHKVKLVIISEITMSLEFKLISEISSRKTQAAFSGYMDNRIVKE